jgi:hypothetical protein
MRDRSGRLSIHRAAENKASSEMVDALLKAHPEGARQKDELYELLPLHWAAAKQAPAEVMDALLKA